jgi:hypothetical protein
MADDNATHLVSQVIGNQIEQSDVEIDGVMITSMPRRQSKTLPLRAEQPWSTSRRSTHLATRGNPAKSTGFAPTTTAA